MKRMFRRRRCDPAAQSEASELPLHRLKWTLLLAGFGVALGGAIWFTVWLTPRLGDSTSGSFFSGIPQAVARTAAVVTPVVLTAILFVYAFWRFRLEWMSWNSAAVAVLLFTDKSNAKDSASRSVDELTASFQAHLARSRLPNHTAVPGIGGSDDFIRVVENAGDAAKGPWKVASRFVRLLFPQAAYEVTGTVLPSAEGAPCALAVSLTKLPKWSAAPHVIRGATWERTVELAAHAIAAQILPRTRACDRAPWTHWRGCRIPAELFDAYQRTQVLWGRRRYDEALQMLDRALRRDPSNVWLRLDFGQLQEQLDLRLDALLTYDDVLQLLTDHARMSRWRAPDPACLVARYRHAVLLALGDKLSEQWWDRPEVCPIRTHWTARERQRAHLRSSLRRRLLRRYDDSREPVETAQGHWSVRQLLNTKPAAIAPDERAKRRYALRVLFTELAQEEIERLEADYRDRWRWILRGRARLNRIVSQRSIRACLVWAHLRHAMALKAAGRPICSAGLPSRGLRGPRRLKGLRTLFDSGTWPPEIGNLRTVVNQALRRRFRPKVWQEHYNAACAYAVALLEINGVTAANGVRKKLARAAVDELYNAASCADSGFLAGQRSWLESEDPDLDQLRATRWFHDFATAAFPDSRPVSRYPVDIHIWELSCYRTALVRTAALAIESQWHRRIQNLSGSVDPHVLDTWWREDAVAWRKAIEIAVDYRDWPTRALVLRLTQQWSRRETGTELVIDYPRYSEETLLRQYINLTGAEPTNNGSRDPVSEWANAVIEAGDRRLAELAWILHKGNEAIPADPAKACVPCLSGAGVVQREHQLWHSRIARADIAGTPISASQARKLGQRCGERWKNLAAWFDDNDPDAAAVTARRREFADSIAAPIDRVVTIRSQLATLWSALF